MRVALRETGSILVRARQDEVLDVLQRTLTDATVVAPGRVERAAGHVFSTYIVRPEADGTRVVHARSEEAPVSFARKPREELRRQVQSELFELQQLLEVRERTS